MGVYRHRKMENSYERPDETGELTRLVLERGHKRRNDSKLSEKHLLSKGLPSNVVSRG